MKLSPITIILIGLSILIMALSYGLFQHYLPNKAEAANFNTFAEQLKTEGDKLPQAEKRLKNAKERVSQYADQWRGVVETRTPEASLAARGVDISVDLWQLVKDTRDFRNNVQRAINAQLVKGGVKVVGDGPLIETPTDSAQEILAGFYNYPAIAFPVTIFNLGQVTVEGTYEQILENVRAWKNMPHYLAVADGLSLEGTSPHLRGTYSVTVVGYIRGKKIYPSVPESGATGGTTGGGPAGFGGGPAGVGPGMRGGPAGMPPNGPGMMPGRPGGGR
ncbi:MAG: hypothetical protein BGO01_03435 [Armatimonadetes bacterium 55-13]|nr:hypothetical protein [Armatimonadota bacterium]ODU53516.1 MAG: hypothetical protein ABT09_01690 [bacterium SCN 57-13]OJU63006.1 MAG: hypothetical protein BGO01_03435 [Armatimonadetes bacterium 55-13]